jgi:hypothetical protein
MSALTLASCDGTSESRVLCVSVGKQPEDQS